MNNSLLLEYTQKAGLRTGALSAYYDLSGSIDTIDPEDRESFYRLTSGATNTEDTYIVYNQLHATGTQLQEAEEGDNAPLFNVDNYPAVITSNSTSLTGSGNFDGRCSLGLVPKMSGDAWTCFLDFSGGFNADYSDLCQVLVSSMTGVDCSSGFHVGINGSNRLYYEYLTGTIGNHSFRQSETLDYHLKRLNLISVAKNPNLLEISLHRPNETTLSLKSPLDGFTDSHEFYLGGMSHGQAYKHSYTGFSGHINTVALFSDYISETSRDTLAGSFFLDSFTHGGLSTGERFTKEVTGVQVQNIQEGWKVTGYELKPAHTYKNEAGEDVTVYYPSGVLGRNYREILVDLTGHNTIRSITGFYTDDAEVNKDSYISDSNAVPGQIKFFEALSAGELVEIYNHSQFLNTINHVSNTEYFFDTLKDSDNASFDLRGYQLKNDNFSFDSNKQPFVQFFRNGILNREVSGLYSVSDIYKDPKFDDIQAGHDGDYYINDNNAGTDGLGGVSERIENDRYEVVLKHSQIDSLGPSDSILFDVVSGASLTGYYQGANVHFVGDYLGKDIYLDGRKLMSGHDYSQSSDGGETSYLIDASEIGENYGDGVLVFVPQASPAFTRVTGDAGGESFDVDNIFFEQVWRNGVRQVPGINYLRAPKDSLIGTGGASFTNDSFAFKDYRSTIDIDVDRNVPKTKNKLFSFDSEERTNLFSSTS